MEYDDTVHIYVPCGKKSRLEGNLIGAFFSVVVDLSLVNGAIMVGCVFFVFVFGQMDSSLQTQDRGMGMAMSLDGGYGGRHLQAACARLFGV